jgi:hypothetical protein
MTANATVRRSRILRCAQDDCGASMTATASARRRGLHEGPAACTFARMNRPILFLALTVATVATVAIRPSQAGTVPAGARLASPLDSTLLAGYAWRNIGPDRGGRSIAVSGVRGRKHEAYFGATGGGLWKTTDGGEHWFPVTDGQVKSASVGRSR